MIDSPRGEEESLFSRDEESGHLVRMSAATAADLERQVTITIDGHEITVPKAVPATDEQGNIERDEDGLVIPRATTIYDAASKLYREVLGRESNPIPVLCHREYMDPVAVCRVCVVQIAKFKARTGRVDVERKLLPACQHRVEDTMIVDTIASPNAEAATRVRRAVSSLTDLLMAEHPSPCAKHRQSGDCELESLAHRLDLPLAPPTPRAADRLRDDSSLVIAVDHNACILCDRCIRGCNDIKENHVLGRAGKGPTSRIAFDLDSPMGASSCVACGECMVSCPTGALTFKSIVEAKLPEGEDVSEDDLFDHPIREIREAFGGLSRPFLRWNARSVVRRTFKKGEIICREGDFGATAFLLENGSVDIFLATPTQGLADRPERSAFGRILQFTSRLAARPRPEDDGDDTYISVDAPVALPLSRPRATLAAGDLFGEMTCMNFYPRSATVRAAEDCTVLEMLRNVLYVMQRSPSFRRVLEAKYRDRAIDNQLRSVPLLAPARRDAARFEDFISRLRARVRLRRCVPGEVILRQGAPATEGFFIVRTGFVKVSQERPGGDRVLSYVGPGGFIGEIGLMSELHELADLGLRPVRTATCVALDHVDLVALSAQDFRDLVDEFPAVREQLVAEARRRISDSRDEEIRAQGVSLGDFLDQGLFSAQSLLVLDLEKCTRCDECTKACADTHGGVTRLIREGLRFDKYLVASSCRSCLDPYCMVGCPVGSIRRRDSLEILIEDWCIGCGLCAENCPYGNINMVQLAAPAPSSDAPSTRRPSVSKATLCDLCSSLGAGTEPSCVYACPHDAAHRMTGPDLLSAAHRNPR